MKIIRRCAYKIYDDELIFVGATERIAKLVCNELNKLNEDRMVYYQWVSDNFELKRKDKE